MLRVQTGVPIVGAAKLATYNAKRNFTKTREPPGRSVAGASDRLRFVIQKHAARRLHYDLRLELAGTFKSWAVTRGPSLDPADKRLAVEVEDHPLAYGDFEGTIPAGEYGGGTVQLWDRGYWQPDEDQSPEQSLKQGELKFSLDGERLHGGWVLVRMRNDRDGGKRTNWLLIKHRDAKTAAGKSNGHSVGRATEKLMAEDRSIASGRSMAQIAAHEGPEPIPFMKAAGRAGTSHSATATAKSRSATRPQSEKPPRLSKRSNRSGRMPAFVEPQLCKLIEHAPPGDAWVHEIKLDGYRIQIRVADGRATLKTRKGLDWTDKFAQHRRGGGAAARLPHRRRTVRARSRPAQQLRSVAGRVVGRQDRGAGVFRLRPALSRRARPAAVALDRAQGSTAETVGRAPARRVALRRSRRWQCRRGLAYGMLPRSRRHRLQASRCTL